MGKGKEAAQAEQAIYQKGFINGAITATANTILYMLSCFSDDIKQQILDQVYEKTGLQKKEEKKSPIHLLN